MKTVRLIVPAERELAEAAEWYESQEPGLGAAFLDEVDRALGEIAAAPSRFPPIGRDCHRKLIGRFPYGIIYHQALDEIVVLAAMHLHRRPDYWTDRL